METTSDTTTTTVVPPKSNKGLIIGLIVAVVALLLCVLAGFLLFLRNNQSVNQNLTCDYNGTIYTNGAAFKALDGCNTCVCSNGSAACTEKACLGNESENPAPTPTEAPPAAGIEETLIGKLMVTDSDYFYGTTKYPDSIMNLRASDLLSITCYDHYTNFTGGIHVNSNDETISDSNINAFLNSFPENVRVNTISYCITAEGKYVVEYETCTSQCGGGIGTIAYFGILDNNALVKITQIPNQLGAYFTCDKSIALTKNYEFYMRCGAGDGPSGAAAIYKVFLNEGNYSEIVRVNI